MDKKFKENFPDNGNNRLKLSNSPLPEAINKFEKIKPVIQKLKIEIEEILKLSIQERENQGIKLASHYLEDFRDYFSRELFARTFIYS